MNVLILNGSPRIDGSLAQMLRAMGAEARSRGAQVEYIDVNHLAVRPCTACMICRTKGECILPIDDAQRMLDAIRRCDLMVVGTPTYWGNMPGKMKMIFDRLVYGFMREQPGKMTPVPLLEGRRAIIVATCNTPWPWSRLFRQSSGAVRAVKEVLRWSGIKVIKTIERGAMRSRPIGEADFRKVRKIMLKVLSRE